MKTIPAVALMLFAAAIMFKCDRAAPKSPGAGNAQPSLAKSVDPRKAADSNSDSRRLKFSGFEWIVKSSSSRVGPGPNYFADSNDNVTVDTQGRLHLRITQHDGRWYCAEVVSARSFGYGTYRFYLDSNIDNMDPQAVLGMFTWNDAPAYNHREIDIEVSRWGQVKNRNCQFVVQPYTRRQNILRFQIPSALQSSTHSFVWKPGNVSFQSAKGYSATPQSGLVIEEHVFTEGIPLAGGENARLNLWLFFGRSPDDHKDVEVVIREFEFVPLP